MYVTVREVTDKEIQGSLLDYTEKAEVQSKKRRGGKRPGAGRKKITDPKITKNVTLPSSVWAIIEKMFPDQPVHRALSEFVIRTLLVDQSAKVQKC